MTECGYYEIPINFIKILLWTFAYFEFNENNPGTMITYVDFPESLTWSSKDKQWNWRKNTRNDMGFTNYGL